MEGVTFDTSAITRILNYKEERQSFLFQICKEQVTMTKFSHAGISQKTSKIKGLASSMEDSKLLRFYHPQASNGSINFVIFNSQENTMSTVFCDPHTMVCLLRKQINIGNTPKKILANTDGTLYMVTQFNFKNVVKFNQDCVIDEKFSYVIDPAYRMVNLFNNTWIGYNDSTIDILKIQTNTDDSKTLVKDRQLISTELVYYSHSTETFFFIPFRDADSGLDQIVVGTFVGTGMKYYVVYAIQGDIIDAYE